MKHITELCNNSNCHLRGNCWRYVTETGKFISAKKFVPKGEYCGKQIKVGL